MTDDREPFREARNAWKAKHHEQRLENATYTAAEVKVFTEAALRLGRKEAAGEDIARMLEARADIYSIDSGRLALRDAAIEARWIASQPSPDATSGRTDPGARSDDAADAALMASGPRDPAAFRHPPCRPRELS